MSERDLAVAAREQRYDDFQQVIALPAPAAGAVIAPMVVPGGQVWRPLSFTYTLATSATIGNRQVGYTIDDGTTVVQTWISAQTQAASLTVRNTFASVGSQTGAATTGGALIYPWAPPVMLPGWRIAPSCLLIAVADQFSAAALLVERLDLGHWLARGERSALVDTMQAMAWDLANLEGI